ncbi:alpha/beta hydrolase family esterase [Neptunicoccus cionae]|uniref:Phospholipase/carboxylesterase/thioesterase domain-containing protein n=1 Tax=Neptunicoccus cionae TaxID=2035344 RepID=A0A916VTG1_9RHOB|nr:prolyl oligopeptidase family serine peptidase [Amylibacter cionae]GGA31100.1 hypothetical protein GCM10011498_35370 [Amylibacter cionae]
MRALALVFALAGPLVTTVPNVAVACSATSPCVLENGDYHIAQPLVNSRKKPPAVVYLHGAGGSGRGAMRNTALVKQFVDRGYVFAAPSGLPWQGRQGGIWSFHPKRNQARDEIAFLTDVRDDLISRHNVDPDRILLVGFSVGGSMTAYLACAAPGTFDAYAPLAGNFWRPHPESCVGPVQMMHTHGWSDGTVPLEGRILRGDGIDDPNSLVQGDIFHAMTIWRDTNACQRLQPNRFFTEGPFMRRIWDSCAAGSALQFALFPGGHRIPAGWSDLVLDWYEGLDSPAQN